MLIKKLDSKKVENSETCTIQEYSINDKEFSFATAVINGRYPIEKRVVNLICEIIYYVTSGKGVIHSEKGDFEIEEGDFYFLEKGEKYWVEGDELKLVLVDFPKWNLEQFKIVD